MFKAARFGWVATPTVIVLFRLRVLGQGNWHRCCSSVLQTIIFTTAFQLPIVHSELICFIVRGFGDSKRESVSFYNHTVILNCVDWWQTGWMTLLPDRSRYWTWNNRWLWSVVFLGKFSKWLVMSLAGATNDFVGWYSTPSEEDHTLLVCRLAALCYRHTPKDDREYLLLRLSASPTC